MITLYHGSNVEIREIDLCKSKKGRDFGRGFYLNPNRDQALDMAQRTAKFLGGTPIITEFEFDPDILSSDELKIKVFPEYNAEWAEFIVRNRQNKSEKSVHDFDIVVGPIADDTVGVQIRRFILGYLPVSQLVEELKFIKPATQYFFGTVKAINFLKRK